MVTMRPAMVHDPYAALRVSEYRAFLISSLTVFLATQIQSTVLGWQVYELTGDPLALGLVGLAEALPLFARDVLKVGEVGFGVLRAAPAVGAIGGPLLLARHGQLERARAAPPRADPLVRQASRNLGTGSWLVRRAPWHREQQQDPDGPVQRRGASVVSM
jgi:hypothetical protein